MSTYAELTTEEQDEIQAWLNEARALMGELAGRIQAKAEILADTMPAAININTDLGDIPNTSGLAGAQPLTRNQIINGTWGIKTMLSALASDWGDSNVRSVAADAAGVNALVSD